MAERIKYGTTWWGKAWMDALKNCDHANRLSRGRSYYSSGRIDAVEFHPETLSVTALVNGSAYFPYEVSIHLPRIEAKTVDRLVEEISTRPQLVAKLLHGDLDPEVAEIAKGLGIDLFPTSWKQFKMRCTCPDVAVPCKHIAAVYYAIVKTIDADPMWVFTCRGVDLVERLKTRGIDLENAERIEDPTWAAILTEERPDIDTSECGSLNELPFYPVKELTDILTGLLPSSGGNRKELSRARFVKQFASLSRWAADRDVCRSAEENEWHKWESSLPVGSVTPALVFEGGRPRLCLKTCVGNNRQPVSPGQKARMVEALASTGPDEAAAHSEGLQFCSGLMQAALTLIKRGAIVPTLMSESVGESETTASVVWLPAVQDASVAAFVAALASVLEKTPAALEVPEGVTPTPWGTAVALLGCMLNEIVIAAGPLRAPASMTRLWEVMARPQSCLIYGRDDDKLTVIRHYLEPLSLGRRSFRWQPVLTVRSAKNSEVTVNLGVLPRPSTAEDRPVLYRDIIKGGRYADERFAMISVFESFARVCPELSTVLETEGKPAHLQMEELKDFLFNAVPSLQMLGARVMLPKNLQRLLRPQLKGRLDASANMPSMLTAEALADFSWEISLGGTVLTEDEFYALQDKAGQIVRWNDEFVYLDPEVLEKMCSALEAKKGPSALEQFQAMLSGEINGVPVTLSDTLRERVRELTDIQKVPLPAGLRAQLRPYQVRGYEWLTKNIRLGMGALIADDMGLGKTVQVIAALLSLKEQGELNEGKILAAVPASLLTNWEREVARFAPALSVSIYHGNERELPPPDKLPDITLTTYGTLRRDIKKLSAQQWRVLVIDEAQAVKNSGTGVAQAVKALPARQVIAMSGTPVENKLGEYWSLLSVVQPGLLGTSEEFRKRFARPIEADHDLQALESFRRITAPFMLRRLKTDRSIIADLPDKIVSNRYAALTPEQAALYQRTLERLMKRLNEAEAAGEKSRRSAVVLELITALKQICNSPSQFTKSESMMPDSGKGTALLELIDECRASHRKVLVFTQYREMGERLQTWIQSAFGRRPRFLHGGVPVAKRTEMVDSFQNDPAEDVMIISLKAGGTGLNLTAASAVVHYDLWWNPAVENQATDRAYRIGQKRDVLVFRFICSGTFEEKIDQMLVQKRELADMTVVTGENWIGDLSSSELSEVFSLSA